jgi:hypothetical protein
MIRQILLLTTLTVNSIILACGGFINGLPSQQPIEATRNLSATSAPGSTGATPGLTATRAPESTEESTSAVLENIGKWKRFEISYSNPSWSGNPFDLEFSAQFSHVSSGRVLNQLGFYAGENTWKIYFMPDELGEWTFTTESPDPELDGKTGSFTCVPSDLPGRLTGDGNRWKLEDSGEYVAPVLIATREWFKRTNTVDGIDDFVLWAKDTTGALVIGTTLVYFNGAQEEIPYMQGEEGITFNIEMWDRLNSHYDYLRDQGMGFYIMFYSDDAESPNSNGIEAQSPAELRLLRYAAARFSAYPIVMWDTGIDIDESRSLDWIDWFADWLNTNDPYQHMVSSRTGGGSGGKFPENGTFYSDGAATLPKHSLVVSGWNSRDVPTAFTDRWRENYTRGNFDPDLIRRAVWEVGLVGGTGVYVSGNENDGYLTENYAADFEAAPYVGYRTKFFQEQVVDFGSLVPHTELLSTGSNFINKLIIGDNLILAADSGNEYVVYGNVEGPFSIDLSQASGTFSATWFNPRTGETSSAGSASGGGMVSFTTPDNQDWVLHLISGGSSGNSNPCTNISVANGAPGGGQAVMWLENMLQGFHLYLPMAMDCGS